MVRSAVVVVTVVDDDDSANPDPSSPRQPTRANPVVNRISSIEIPSTPTMYLAPIDGIQLAS